MSAGVTPVKPTHVMGIDPGLSGAIAIYSLPHQKLEAVHDMPTSKNPKNGKTVMDLAKLAELVGRYSPYLRLCVIEEVGARPNQGLTSTFNFGLVTGYAAGAVAALRVPLVWIKPAIWKSLLCLSRDKNESRELAKKMFGGNHFDRAKDDGRAEAALLAKFAAERLT